MSAKDICLVELCNKNAEKGQLCAQHRRKYVKGELQVDLSEHKIWDTCSRHHRWTLSNIHWESVPGKTTKRRRCRKCLALKAQRRRRSAANEIIPPAPVDPGNAVMSRAIEDLSLALEEGEAKCKGSTEWTDYEAKDTPSNEKAMAMCAGCPFFEACSNGATAQLPGWGVWAGAPWYMGMPLTTEQRWADMREAEESYED